MEDELGLTGCGEPPPIKTLTCDTEKLRRRVDEVYGEIAREVAVGPQWDYQQQPCRWRMQLFKDSPMSTLTSDGPNWFHRMMQRLVLGIVWTEVKKKAPASDRGQVWEEPNEKCAIATGHWQCPTSD